MREIKSFLDLDIDNIIYIIDNKAEEYLEGNIIEIDPEDGKVIFRTDIGVNFFVKPEELNKSKVTIDNYTFYCNPHNMVPSMIRRIQDTQQTLSLLQSILEESFIEFM